MENIIIDIAFIALLKKVNTASPRPETRDDVLDIHDTYIYYLCSYSYNLNILYTLFARFLLFLG